MSSSVYPILDPTIKVCKLCVVELTPDNTDNKYPNIDKVCDICWSCGCGLKKYEKELVNDKVKFMRKIRCNTCNFRMCEINKTPVCMWCLDDTKIYYFPIEYKEYKDRTYAYVMSNDFETCTIAVHHYPKGKLSELTRRVLEMRKEE